MGEQIYQGMSTLTFKLKLWSHLNLVAEIEKPGTASREVCI